ncbi:LysR family transcriptional regulator [Neorhizobium sp. BT27B]|uniref:LysR family transcriptional regulator n=1 Tax=Neorhizobium sp. BT27B TaxID=3142625 RepID=UPI003D268F82
MKLSRRTVGIEWDKLQFFAEVVNAGGVRSAAKSLGLSAATISRNLLALEKSIDRELFVREKSGMRLTAYGEQLVEDCRTIDAIVSQVEARMHTCAMDHEVRIAAVPSIGQELLIPHLDLLRRKYANVRFSLNTSSDNCDLDARGIDIAIRASRPERGDYVVRRLGQLSLGCYARSPQNGAMPSGKTLPLVVLGATKFDAQIRNSLILGLYPDNPVSDFQSLINAMRAGLGQGLIPDFVARKYRDLSPVPDQGEVFSADIWIIIRAGSYRSRIVKDIASEIERLVSRHLRGAEDVPDPRTGCLSCPSREHA